MDKTQQPSSALPEGGGQVTSPRAAAYAERVGVKKYVAPVGGVPAVSIPPLDAPYARGQTMAAQAQGMRGPSLPQSSIFGPQGANPFTQPGGPPAGRPESPQTQILPTDLLPEEARRDPAFREGPGSMFAMSQPKLVGKYGVMRNGTIVPPAAFRAGGRGGPSPETMAAVAELNNKFAHNASTAAQRAEDTEVEKEVAGGPVGAARAAGASAGAADPKLEKDLKSRLESMDKLDLHRLQEMGVVDLLNNDEQKTLIEERCSKITLDEYVMNGFVRQRVPIVPGVFEVTFQSMALEDELTLKNLIAKEANALELSDRYLVDKYGYMGLAVGLHMIHSAGKDIPFPSHLSNEGVFDEALFWAKFKRVLRLPFHLAASLAINFFWFEVRVRRLPRAAKSAGVA
jgi:hypothetical protein